MRQLGLSTSPLHLPLAPQTLIKGFFSHPAAALLTGLGRSLPLWPYCYWGRWAWTAEGTRLHILPCQACWPEGSGAQVKNLATRPARGWGYVFLAGKHVSIWHPVDI